MIREICGSIDQRYADVIAAHRTTEAIDPSFIYFQSWVAAAHRELGDYPAALREYDSAAKALGGAPQYGLALTYHRMGRDDGARNILDAMDELSKTQYVPSFARAVVHGNLGDLDTAVTLLQRAVDSREGMLLAMKRAP